jgi:putative transposase
MKYTYMNERLNQYTFKAWCEGLKVSASGFYAWRNRSHEPKEIESTMNRIYAKHKGKIGAPMLCADLKAEGFVCSVRTVSRLMKKSGLRAKLTRKFRLTTDSKHKLPLAPNRLKRQFTVDKPNSVWVGDITYLQTNQGWLYLAVMLDLYSRQVVGWQISDRIDQTLVNDALLAALANRGYPKGVMVHTDRGSQYCAKSFIKIMRKYKAIRSMSRKGNCWDNAVAESFFATLKKQTIHGYKLQTKDQMRNEIFAYIEIYYNRVRRHSANNWVSPVDFEALRNQSLEGLALH